MLQDITKYPRVLSYALWQFENCLDCYFLQRLNYPAQQARCRSVEGITSGGRNKPVAIEAARHANSGPDVGCTKLEAALEHIDWAIFKSYKSDEADRFTAYGKPSNSRNECMASVRVETPGDHHVTALPLLGSVADFRQVLSVFQIRKFALRNWFSGKINLCGNKSYKVQEIASQLIDIRRLTHVAYDDRASRCRDIRLFYSHGRNRSAGLLNVSFR